MTTSLPAVRDLLKQLRPDDSRDLARSLGSLLLGAGALMLAIRKEDSWPDYPLFLVYVLPAVLLFGGAVYSTRLTTRGTRATQRIRAWQAVAAVFGIFFVLLALNQFVDMVGGNPDAPLNTFWTFGVTAALAAYAGLVVGIRWQLLAAGLFAVISVMALLDEIISFGDDLGAFRGFLGLCAAGLLVAGIVVWRSDQKEGLLKFSELFTAAGIAAVIACALSVTAVFEQAGDFIEFFDVPTLEANWFWDLLLLVISLGLIVGGSLIGVRGPAYVGAIGLLFFIGIAGADLDSDPDSRDPSKFVGWPLILLGLGAAGIAASFWKDFSLGDRPQQLVRFLSGR